MRKEKLVALLKLLFHVYMNCVFNWGFVSLSIHVICRSGITPDWRQWKTSILSMNVDKKNRKKQSFRLPFVDQLATNGNRKHCI